MAAMKAGDKARIKTREVTSEDSRTGLYFTYFGGLTGMIDRVYDDGSVCIDIDLDSLSQDTRERHLAMQEAERKRWLDGISGELRNRLSEEQKKLTISYKLLVSEKDLESYSDDSPKPGKKQAETSSESKADAKSVSGESNTGAAQAAPAASAKGEDSKKRLSEADLAAKEEEYLHSLQNKS